MIKIVLLVILSELITVVGQLLYKKSVNEVGPHDLKSMPSLLRFLSEVLKKPRLWLGVLAMAAGLVVWLVALSRGDLSLVFPLGSVQYIMILFLAHVFLDEKIDRMKFIGTFLVVLGIILITLT